MEDIHGMKYEDHLEWVNDNKAKGIEMVTDLCTQEVCNRALSKSHSASTSMKDGLDLKKIRSTDK